MAKVVECEVCGNHFAVTDEQHKLIQEVATSLTDIGKAQFICKFCKKMVNTK